MKNILSLLLLASLLISCDSKTNLPAPDAKPIQLSDIQKVRVTQDNDFAFDLMKQTLANTDSSNVFISPLSVSICLGMVWNGAVGETKSQMETALKLTGMSEKEINEYYKLMQTKLPLIDPGTKLSISNAIWYHNSFSVKPDFLKINADYFNATSKGLDFTKPASLETINGWAKEKTNGLIPKVLNFIDPDARMLLMNAIYFKGTWVQKFDKKNTREADFTNEKNTKVKVNMMQQEHEFPYTEDDFAQYLDLPYGNKAFNMTVILPKSQNTIGSEFPLTSAMFGNALKNMYEQKVQVSMPRFEVKNKFKLNNMLQAMGMELPFAESADFTGMSDSRPLFIGFVQHDTYVRVDEEGTEAAAVTTTGMYTTSLPQIKIFNVNKPFYFVIREKSSGIVLFMGKMGDVKKF